MPIALIVELAAAIIGQAGTVVNLVEYLKAHPDHATGKMLPDEHQLTLNALIGSLRAHAVANSSGAPALPWDRPV